MTNSLEQLAKLGTDLKRARIKLIDNTERKKKKKKNGRESINKFMKTTLRIECHESVPN